MNILFKKGELGWLRAPHTSCMNSELHIRSCNTLRVVAKTSDWAKGSSGFSFLQLQSTSMYVQASLISEEEQTDVQQAYPNVLLDLLPHKKVPNHLAVQSRKVFSLTVRNGQFYDQGNIGLI